MPKLPSIYSDEGLNENDSKKFITTRLTKLENGDTMEYRIKELIKDLKSNSNDDDIMMIGSDDFREVESITHLVRKRREENEENELSEDHTVEDELSMIDDSTVSIPSQKSIFLVIDTNFIISHLDILDNMVKLHDKYKQAYQVIIPRTTLQELDGLKNSRAKMDSNSIISNGSIAQLARWANEWCYQKLADCHPLVRGQKFDERLDLTSKKDDSILDCCLYFQKTYPSHLVILFSNDKNFCNKLLINGILTVSYRPKMNAKLIINTIVLENLNRGNGEKVTREMNLDNEQHQHSILLLPPVVQQIPQQQRPASYLVTVENFETGVSIVYQEIETLLKSRIHKLMYNNYGEDLELISYKEPQDMHDVFEIILRYWNTVFSVVIDVINFKREFDRHKNDFVKSTLTNVPRDLESLRNFLKFWKLVLIDLYIDRSQTDKDALEIFCQRWDFILEQFQ